MICDNCSREVKHGWESVERFICAFCFHELSLGKKKEYTYCQDNGLKIKAE